MWFASIWIFTLKLPWELGANLFMKYLYDGDAASNTLSWRWIAGLQTSGKHYVATSENISKYTNQKFKPMNIEENVYPINQNKIYDIQELKLFNSKKSNDELLILDNNIDFKNNKIILNKYKNIYLLSLDNDHRKIKLCDNVLSFKNLLIKEYSGTIPHSKIISYNELLDIMKKVTNIDILYPGIGENLSFIQKLKNKDKFNYIYNENDLFCWKFSKKGFFNFKNNIPSIIERITN